MKMFISFMVLIANAGAADYFIRFEQPGQIASLKSGDLEVIFESQLVEGLILVRTSRALSSLKRQIPAQYIQADSTAEITSSDPFYSRQTALKQLRAPIAWTTTTGRSDVKVAVIDTGMDAKHSDFAPTKNGYDFLRNTDQPIDEHGHGTHVAGIIAALQDNGIGITGAAPGVSLMPLKFMGGDGRGAVSGAIRAIEHAVLHGAKIINNSWIACNDGPYEKPLKDILTAASKRGVLLVFAAGNAGADLITQKCYPAALRLPTSITVGALRGARDAAPTSNFSTTLVDLFAPGTDIMSAFSGDRYVRLSGTSQAAPFVAAAAALVWSEHPEYTAKEVRERVLKSVITERALAKKAVTAGRLDMGLLFE